MLEEGPVRCVTDMTPGLEAPQVGRPGASRGSSPVLGEFGPPGLLLLLRAADDSVRNYKRKICESFHYIPLLHHRSWEVEGADAIARSL